MFKPGDRIQSLAQTHIIAENPVLIINTIPDETVPPPRGIAFKESVKDDGGRYEITEAIGRNQSNTIYAGYDHKNRRRIALRINEYVSVEAMHSIGGRFQVPAPLETAITLSQLNHPNIPKVYDFTLVKGKYAVIVEELIDSDMSFDIMLSRLRENNLPIERLINIFEQIGGALDYLHSKNLLHNDLGNDQILVERVGQKDQRAVLIDYDTLKKVSETDLESNISKNTSRWQNFPPEILQLFQKNKYIISTIENERWAFLVTFFSGLTGKLPFKKEDVYSDSFSYDDITKLSGNPALLKLYGEETCKKIDDFFLDAFKNYKNIESCDEAIKTLKKIF